jgi:hypothetical protein
MLSRLAGVGVMVWLGLWSAGLRAQSSVATCGVPPGGKAAVENLFNEQQEIWLGQVEADLVESDVRPVQDRALNEHLQSIADRLLATMPPTKIQFTVTLVESNEVNAYSIAGGHIYVYRKLAAIAGSDDELAGVIGHEIGHILVHHSALDASRDMVRLLHITSVGDKEDIRRKFGAMLDAEYTDKHPDKVDEAPEEAQADQIGVYTAAAAGYRAQAYSDFWNRAFFVKGRTGSKLGDFLGITKPNQKRLRSINAFVAALPGGCGSKAPPRTDDFAAWHRAVVENQKGEEVARSVALHEATLTPPLRMELDQVRFSPDGRSILAQDQSSIFVLGREPLALRYRIDARQAMPAHFSPDSRSITFSTPGLHTEQWSTDEKKLLAAHEIYLPETCYDTRLSPDGRTLLCVQFDTEDWRLDLALVDTETSTTVWKKKGWLEPNGPLGYNLLVSAAMQTSTPFFVSSYSASGQVLLFGGGDAKVAFDLSKREVIKPGWDLKSSISGEYAFIGDDRVAGRNLSNPMESNVFSFPGGAHLLRTTLPPEIGTVTHPGDKQYVLGYGMQGYGVCLLDLASQKYVLQFKTHAMDVDGETVVGENNGGKLGIVQIGSSNNAKQQIIELPLSPLPYGTRSALSKDGRYLAISTQLRGGVWEVQTGKMLALVKGFTDAYWSDDDTVYMDVPKDKTVERHITRLVMQPRKLDSLPYKVDDETHLRYGRLTDWKLDAKKKSWTLAMHDPSDGKVIWSRVFADRYFSYTASLGDRDLIFDFPMSARTAKDAVKADAALAQQLQAIKKKDNARLIKILGGKTGEDAGSLVVELPPNFAGTDGLNRVGDLLYVGGFDDRTKVYSLKTAHQVRELTGYLMALDAETGRVFTANRVGEGVVYDAEGQELAHYQLGDPIRYALFREGAKVVTVLTADQKVRTMQVLDSSDQSAQVSH